MTKIDSITLIGCSKKSYQFAVYPGGSTFKALGAIYFISKRINSEYTPIYLGITNDLSTRFNSHHKDDCFKKYGANCISVLLNSNESQREEIEKDILCNYNFPCNEINN